VAYDKLNFVGVISSKNKRIALIETEGSKGHSAKIGTLLGPNLGAVEVVREDRIIVIERYRNYLGEVLANKQNIEFSTPQLQG
jgi:Tfp pilus assembly protein PilP